MVVKMAMIYDFSIQTSYTEITSASASFSLSLSLSLKIWVAGVDNHFHIFMTAWFGSFCSLMLFLPRTPFCPFLQHVDDTLVLLYPENHKDLYLM